MKVFKIVLKGVKLLTKAGVNKNATLAGVVFDNTKKEFAPLNPNMSKPNQDKPIISTKCLKIKKTKFRQGLPLHPGRHVSLATRRA